MEMKRGDIVVAIAPGDYGKARPALVVQSDLFNPTHASVVICPITSHLGEMPLFRLPINPSPEHGIKKESQIMIDKITAIKKEKIGKRVGRLRPADMRAVDEALLLWMSLDQGAG